MGCVGVSKVGQRFVVLSKDRLAWTCVEWNGLGWFGVGVLEWIGMRCNELRLCWYWSMRVGWEYVRVGWFGVNGLEWGRLHWSG